MKRVKLLGWALLTVFTLGAALTATASWALPTVLFLTGEKLPVFATDLSPAEVSIEGPGETLKGKGFASTILLTSTTSTFTASLSNVAASSGEGAKCSTSGEPSGVVLITGETSLVWDSLSPTLGVAALVTVPEFTITCSLTKVKVKGTFLELVKPINTEVLTSESLFGVLRCKESGKPADEVYWNGSGAEVGVKLEANFGLGFESACGNVAEEVPGRPSKMIEVMG